MSDREAIMREYAMASHGRLMAFLHNEMANCPEIIAQADKSVAIGELSDLCASLFCDVLEMAAEADSIAVRAKMMKYGLNYQERAEGRVA